MELLELLEGGIGWIVALLRLMLESIAVACVALGLVTSLKLAAEGLRDRDRSRTFVALRLRFGRWLVLALEFQLAADIVATTVAPSMEALARLAAIAAIRTFLNYFLQKELEAEDGVTKESVAAKI